MPMELRLPKGTRTETQLYRSRYGGPWIDRTDAHALLARRLERGEVTDAEAASLAHYIDHGYVIFPKAVDAGLVDAYVAFLERSFDDPPPQVYAHTGGQVLPLSRDLYDKVAKISDLHYYFDRADELIFPKVVVRFMSLVYERPPVAFQTMSMRKGSEEPLHTDTGPLTLTEPNTLAGAWTALQDVVPKSGEFMFVPGSHHTPEVLIHGKTKGHDGDMVEYGKLLARTLELCKERGLERQLFPAKKGDVLIWAADLMHGGAPIEDHAVTRKSLVAHFMPLGVMPTFYDFSKVHALRYPSGGYCLDRLVPQQPDADDVQPAPAPTPSTKERKRDKAVRWVKDRIPPLLRGKDR